jgi:microcystin-dependent protein
MSNYNKATNFAVKDTLNSGDPDKIVSGAEIDNEFNAISSAINSKADNSDLQALAPVPQGGIIMWSGSIGTIPIGWAICNGLNGTPDLRNRFVVAAGDTYSPNDTGGADFVTLSESEMPSHSHSMSSAGSHTHTGSTSVDGGHRHNIPNAGPGSGRSVDNNNRGPEFAQETDFAGDHSHSLNINSNGDHVHSMSNAGGNQSHENRPPYYALAYIMKL